MEESEEDIFSVPLPESPESSDEAQSFPDKADRLASINVAAILPMQVNSESNGKAKKGQKKSGQNNYND